LLAGNALGQTTVEYIHTDALGSPVAVTDTAGVVRERKIYEPYGTGVVHSPGDEVGFTGHVEDSATSLVYMQQRYYDSQLGRFISNDPVKADPRTGSYFNRYKYANNNAYRFTDPDGRLDRELLQYRKEEINREWADDAFIDDGPITPLYPEMALPALRAVKIVQQLRGLLKPKSLVNIVPQKAKDVIKYSNENGGAARAGYKGGKEFKNDSRGGGATLPRKDSDGNAISYKEYDVNPYSRGTNRGAERVVTGSDGRSYYTADRYRTFQQVK